MLEELNTMENNTSEKKQAEIKTLCEEKKLLPMYHELLAYLKEKGAVIDFFECLLTILQAQLNHDRMTKVSRLRKAAKLRWSSARLEDFAAKINRCVEFSVLKQLATGMWIKHFQHIIISGPTGSGKTHLACALANAAIELEYSVFYVHFPTLIRQLKMAERAGIEELTKLRRKFAKAQVLFIDDWGIQTLSNEERHLLFELIEMRDQNSSLLITSQYATDMWHDAFQDKVVADSVLDRIKSYAIELDWDLDSFRRKKGAALKHSAKPAKRSAK